MQCADTASAGSRLCGSRRSVTCGWDMSPTVPTRKEAVEDREACGCSNALRTSACDRRTFRRISRSHIVRLDGIRELQPWFHGDGLVILTSGAKLRLSRRYRDRLYEPT